MEPVGPGREPGTPRGVLSSLKVRNLRRYRSIAALIIKYGRSDVVRHSALDPGEEEPADGEPGSDVAADGKALADDLEELGPTFVKLGQLLSTRADLLPPAYTQALGRLQDEVDPFPFEEVQRIVEAELGARLSNAFSSFEEAPMASASLGQVHRAAMRDGRPVAVKVQRPGIRARVVEDMDALSEIASFLDHHTDAGRRYGFADLLEQFRRSLLDELDYRREATNLRTLAGIVRPYDRIVVPSVIDDFTTDKVLTMELVEGRKITDLGPLAQLEMDGRGLASQLFRAYLDQILVEGFFHADPHPGNVLLTRDHRIALIDLGMVARVPASMQDGLVKLLLAVSEGKGEEVAEVAMTLGRTLDGFDRESFILATSDLVDRNQAATVGEIDAGTLVMELNRVAGDAGLRLPAELSMLGKALLNLDQVAHVLDPDFEPVACVRSHTGEILRGRMTASEGSIFSSLLEAKEFAENLPARVNRVMDSISQGRFELRLKVFDEDEMLRGLQKLANRVTMGLVLAALIVGAAMLMRVETSAKIFGYPSLAIICFLVAAAGGIALLFSIVASDRRINRKTRHKDAA